jgi:hypothetical protein
VTEADGPEGASGKGLADKALGDAATAFGKEIAPLGPKAGALARRIGDLLIRALEPLVFGLEKSANWIEKAVTDRLKDLPQENIVAPDPRIAVPAMQALTYSVGDETIREMFANLLAADMNSETKGRVHPAFVEMIKEISPADAMVLSVLARSPQIEFEARFDSGDRWVSAGYSTSVEAPDLDTNKIRRAISNLKRLEIVEGRENVWPILTDADRLEAQLRSVVEPGLAELNARPAGAKVGWPPGPFTTHIHKIGVYMTPLGEDFAAICMPTTGS